MDNLISPFQASFIPGRCIQDNTVIGKEIVHSINKCRGRRGFCIIKVDLEKAAHKWSFVEDTLKEVGLKDRKKDSIMDCITSSSLNVLWNGGLTEFFQPSRGLRQGDPISPYLFVLVHGQIIALDL